MEGLRSFRSPSKCLAHLLVVLAVGFLLLPSSVVRAQSVVTFPDPNLEAVIREAIGKPNGEIYESDIVELGLVEAADRGIADLTGLEACRLVFHAFFDSNRIRDISPLANVEYADHLFLNHNQIGDISPLAGLSVGEVLELSHNEIRDLSGFHDVGADTVDLSYNRITDLSGLSDFYAGILILDHNQISDIGPLVNNASLVVGDGVSLRANPLSSTSISTYIPALKAKGVQVEWDSYPERPVNVSPVDGATGVTLTPTLQGSPFSEPETDTHVASRWQVRSSSGNYDSPLWDSGSSAAATSIAVPAGKLRNGRVYYWRVGYKDSGGLWSSYSKETSFTTADYRYPNQPVNVSPLSGATGVSLTPTLQGSGFSDPDGDTHVASRWQVRYSNGNYDSPVWDSGRSAPVTSITVPAGKLINGTLYYWRVGYQDGRGLWSSYSKETSFTTVEAAAVPPAVVTVAASGISSISATLNLSLSSLGSASSVQVSFEWGPGTAYGNTTTPQAMNGPGSLAYPLSGLSPATTYYFRAKADGSGTDYGGDMTFTTASTPVAPPMVTTNAANGMAMDSATLNGNLTGLGSAASVQVSFEWGLTASYGNSTPAGTMSGTGNFSADLNGLAPGTAYHYRAKAVGDDTAHGSDMTLTTSATPTTPPMVTSDDADSVTASSARLNGDLTSLGTASSVTVSFVWGTTQGGPYTNETTGAAQTAAGAFRFDLSGLASGTSFYYQAKAVGNGASYGAEESFTTAATTSGAPVIGSLVADNGRPGEDLTLTITGSNLSGATALSFGAGIMVNDFRVVSDTEITAKIAIASGAEAGDRDITVTTPQGTGAAPGAFKVNDVGSRVHLWVYPVAAVGGLAVLGLVASLAVWLLRRPAKPTP